ncbi:MAG: hypothetical protein D6812_09660, partial [Deltaproteobacteria bacterium]
MDAREAWEGGFPLDRPVERVVAAQSRSCRAASVAEVIKKEEGEMKRMGLLLGAGIFVMLPTAMAWGGFSDFTPLEKPIGVAAFEDKLLVTTYCPQQIYLVHPNGEKEIFAPDFPDPGGCIENYIAVSPGFGGFTKNEVFVTAARKIYRISPDGSEVTLFAEISSNVSSHTSLTFDTVGFFDNDMIVVAPTGDVWRVDAQGETTFLAHLSGGTVENPAIAPPEFGPVAGSVIVASENTGKVFAIDPDGTTVVIASGIPGAEGANFVPRQICNFSEEGGAYFGAIYPEKIVTAPAEDFVGFENDLIVQQEASSGGIFRIAWDGENYVATQMASGVGHFEGATFANCYCLDPDGDFYGEGNNCAGPDNCPNNPNPAQQDGDEDGVG